MALIVTENWSGGFSVHESDKFTRIIFGQFAATEEVRIDRPSSYDNGFEYVAIAPSGSDTGLTVWSCVRCTWANKHKTRMQFRENISWDARTIGW